MLFVSNSCEEGYGKQIYSRNLFFQLTVVHPAPILSSENILESKAAHHQVAQHNVDVSSPHLTQHEYYAGGANGQAQQSHLAVGLVIMSVCVLLGILVLAMARMRSLHRKHVREEQEVEMVRFVTHCILILGLIISKFLFIGMG